MRLAFAFALLICQTFPGSGGSTTEQTLTIKLVLQEQTRVETFQEDFLSIAKAKVGSGVDSEASFSMVDSASLTSELLDKVGVMLRIYSRMSCATDRREVKALIGEELQFALKEVDLQIEEASNVIANTNNAGLVATAAKFRDELREIKKMLARPY
jgi:hypothetical protein